jgi:uncharacterized protein (TIGR03437 family)
VEPFPSSIFFTPCRDGYIAVLSADGGKLKFASYFGNQDTDYLVGIGLDPNGDILVGVGSHEMPPAFLLPGSPGGGAFVAKVRLSGSPVLTREQWLVNSISYSRLLGMGPGMLATLFGLGLTERTEVLKAEGPTLPLELDGVSVEIQGRRVPLLALGKSNGLDQINSAVPRDFASYGRGTPVTVALSRNGVRGIPIWALMSGSAAPTVLRQPDGLALATHEDGPLVNRPAPARSGEEVTLYVSGMGQVDPPLPETEVAPADPPHHTIEIF